MPKLTRKRPYVKVPEPEEEPAEDSASEFELPQSVSDTDDDDPTVTSGSKTETRPPKVPKLSKHDDGLKRPPKSKSKKDKESDKGLDGDNADNNSQDVASSDNADKDFSQDDVPEKWRIPQLPPVNKANWSMETFRLKLLPGAFQNFTPNYGRPRHITDYPEIRGYRLDLDQLQLYSIRTTGTLKVGQTYFKSVAEYLPGTGSEVPVWRIVGVWRRPNQKTESIEYFVRIPSKMFPKRNGITTSVCPTEEDAARLGNLVVDYTNRCPSDFSDADWASQPTARSGGTSFAIYARAPKAFCEVTALLEYNKDLDLAQTMGPDWITGFNLRATAKSSIAGAVDLENDRFVGVKVALSTQPVPKDSKAAKLPPTPMAYRPFFRYGTDEATTASKKQQQTFHEHTQASHFGHIGNKQQFSESWNQHQLELGAAQLESRRAMA
ncbi:hypothetical protein B0A48_15989 [Cryoendolithus antarcticus]|uniref:Uncharacterized protein n=1 Tax=Cryoendolithus antarcticus TaxID=1507870 RepID=A0A1V8SGL0_9PEZI|nr:hypothetical protein B0A48_15989 [Cryoendolithus antarcticus]